MIGVGLIGYGLGGAQFHAPLIQAEPGLRLHAVVTSRAGQVQRDHPGVGVVASPAELLEDPAVELVVVAAPNAEHHRLAAAALRAGRHVVVEKPFTLSTADADDLIALAEAADRRLSVFHNRRWDSDFLTVRRCLETGLLGQVSTVASRYDRFRPVPKGSWKEEDVPGSGILWDLGPHLIDQALQLFGLPGTVWADVGVQRPGVEAVDYVHLVLGHGRLRVLLHAGMEVRDPGPRFEVHGDRGSFLTWATRAGGASPPSATAPSPARSPASSCAAGWPPCPPPTRPSTPPWPPPSPATARSRWRRPRPATPSWSSSTPWPAPATVGWSGSPRRARGTGAGSGWRRAGPPRGRRAAGTRR